MQRVGIMLHVLWIVSNRIESCRWRCLSDLEHVLKPNIKFLKWTQDFFIHFQIKICTFLTSEIFYLSWIIGTSSGLITPNDPKWPRLGFFELICLYQTIWSSETFIENKLSDLMVKKVVQGQKSVELFFWYTILWNIQPDLIWTLLCVL